MTATAKLNAALIEMQKNVSTVVSQCQKDIATFDALDAAREVRKTARLARKAAGR